jgi:hypothetical protein
MRGDVYLADLNPSRGSEQAGIGLSGLGGTCVKPKTRFET